MSARRCAKHGLPSCLGCHPEDCVSADGLSEAGNLPSSLPRPAFGPCGNHPDRERKTIAIWPADGETRDEAYARWARKNGRNPWCYHPLGECPEPKKTDTPSE